MLAGAAATLLGWAAAFALDVRRNASPHPGPLPSPGPGLALATLCSCALESATDQLDNAVLPLHYYALLLLAGGV